MDHWRPGTAALFGLLLASLFGPTVPFIQEYRKCPSSDYETEDKICCNKCPAGYMLKAECQAPGQRSNCSQCPNNTYLSENNYSKKCFSCSTCNASKFLVEVSKCKATRNRVCGCMSGRFKYHIDSKAFDCLLCSTCGINETVKENCSAEKDTVCDCKENFYRHKGKCVPSLQYSQSTGVCTESLTTCKDHPLINVVAGLVASFIVIMVLLIVITHFATKKSLEKKLSLLPGSQSDKYEVINVEPSGDDCVEAPPPVCGGEGEPLNLPDCVPLEVKMHQLIYKVLELVSVGQVKQLVRSLGVPDTVIDRAEMDYRHSKEAHYHMFKTWVEGASLSPTRQGEVEKMLLHKLTGKLREIHLIRAAEELEVLYGIQ